MSECGPGLAGEETQNDVPQKKIWTGDEGATKGAVPIGPPCSEVWELKLFVVGQW